MVPLLLLRPSFHTALSYLFHSLFHTLKVGHEDLSEVLEIESMVMSGRPSVELYLFQGSSNTFDLPP